MEVEAWLSMAAGNDPRVDEGVVWLWWSEVAIASALD